MKWNWTIKSWTDFCYNFGLPHDHPFSSFWEQQLSLAGFFFFLGAAAFLGRLFLLFCRTVIIHVAAWPSLADFFFRTLRNHRKKMDRPENINKTPSLICQQQFITYYILVQKLMPLLHWKVFIQTAESLAAMCWVLWRWKLHETHRHLLFQLCAAL